MPYPEFVNNDAFIKMDSSVSEQQQLKAMLANLKRIHQLTATQFASFDELIHQYILSGIDIFGLETGIVSRIENDNYTVCDVISPLEVLKKDQVFALQETYCYEVIKSQSIVGFPNVGQLEYMNSHPVYQNLKLEAYLSAPIYVNNQIFGTLNFTSTTSRKHGFSIHEHDLIELMANSIGTFISLRQKEEKLLALNQQLHRFVGYVSHDLRSPLGAIISFTKMATKPNVPLTRIQLALSSIDKAANQALEFVNTLLDSAALATGKIQLNQSSHTIDQLINDTNTNLALLINDARVDIRTNINPSHQVYCDHQRIEQALSNLLINAIKFSPELSTITISSSQQQKQLLITISNTICEKKVAHGHADNKLYSSTGFGLEIVKEIAIAHNGEFTSHQENGLYTSELCLPAA